jgi:hypothetical protein
MTILFAILLVLNIANPDNIKFVNATVDNNAKYDCEFKWKGISPVVDRPAQTLYGYTAFKQECK